MDSGGLARMNLYPFFMLTALVASLTGGYLIFTENEERSPGESEKTALNGMSMAAPKGRAQPHQVRRSSPYPTASSSQPDSEALMPPPVTEYHAASHATVFSKKAPPRTQIQSAGDKLALWHKATIPEAAIQQPPLEHTEYISAEPGAIQGLLVGDPVEIHVPQTAQSYSGVVISETQHFGKVRVLEVKLDFGDENNNMTITSGERQTFIALNTPDGIFNIQVDNQSGNGTVVNEMEFRTRQSGVDSIPAPNTPVPVQRSHDQ